MIRAALLALALAAGPAAGGTFLEARALLASGKAQEAVDLLKADAGAPGRERALLLAKGYLASGNDFWAVRSLSPLLELDERDCEVRSWLAFVALRQKDPASALEQVAQAECRAGPRFARLRLVEALALRADGRADEARAAIDAAAAEKVGYPEDLVALDALRPVVDPGYIPPVSLRVELAGLWTTNAFAGSPTDPLSQIGAESAGGQVLASLRLVAPRPRAARLSLDAELRGTRFSADNAWEMSTWQVSARPGFVLDVGLGVLAAYRFEALQVAGGDVYSKGPIWFYEAHRGEFEAPLPSSLVLFGGAGWRAFREDFRTRTEVDLGLGGGWSPAAFVHLLAAVTGRGQWAQSDAYDLYGGTLLVSAEWKAGPVAVRTGAIGSFDVYPSSAGAFGVADARSDVLLKASLGVWSPPWAGGKIGATYELSQRFSSAPAYGFTDHRVLAKVVWSGSLDPFTPRAVVPQGHVGLDWQVEGADAEERVQDLLRRDEALQRGSSCVDR